MGSGRDDVLRQVHRLFAGGAAGGTSDGELLGRFAAGRDESAFEALVERHGPMVLRVCRGVLGDGHDAEDAFQATFLVLARRAGSLRAGDSLGRWLFGVARRSAARARRSAARRSRHERKAAEDGRSEASRGVEPDRAEAVAVVVEEVDRLPGSYRSAVVLCYLQGLTYEEAAGRLGVSEGTVRGRLSRARDRLRVRLTRRGVGLPVGLALAGISSGPASALPMGLVDAAVRVGVGAIRGRGAAAGAVPAAVAALGDGVLKETAMSTWKTAATALVLACCGLAAARGLRVDPVANAADAAPPTVPAAEAEDRDRSIQEPSLTTQTTPRPWETAVRVKVFGKNSIGFGSGTVIRSTPEESLVLACGRTFRLDDTEGVPPDRYPHRVTVDLFDGKLSGPDRAQVRYVQTIPAVVVDWLDMDVGLLRIKPGRILPASPIVPPSWKPSNGMEMVTAGCSEGNDATFWTTQIGGVRLLAANPRELIDCSHAPKQGRTGGGLFTPSCELAGVCNYADRLADRGLYATPEAIYRLLDRNGLASLYDGRRSGRESPVSGTPKAAKPLPTEMDLAYPVRVPVVTPSLADHERRLREVERRLERLLEERGAVEGRPRTD